MPIPRTPVVLVVRDGWGIGPDDPESVRRQGNAVAMAQTPVRDRMFKTLPWTTLLASGEAVGLPPGQMGNSEVGHLNLGAGRIVPQTVARISALIEGGGFDQLPPLRAIAERLRAAKGRLHLIALCSDGGVHSDIAHLFAALRWARANRIRAGVHVITDGRDAPPRSSPRFVEELGARCKDQGAEILTVSGRYFAMDRDLRWERTRRAYRAIAEGGGERAASALEHIARCHALGVTDEFIPPAVVANRSFGEWTDDADEFLFLNFRADRARQLAAALAEPNFSHFPRSAPRRLTAMRPYRSEAPYPSLLAPELIRSTLGEILSHRGLPQLRMAETEKYAHVTYFFNGGVEEPFPGEDRRLIPSPDVATYDLKPEMSAQELTDAAEELLETRAYAFVLINYANADMVGHTGSIPAAIRAVETVDECVGRIQRRARAQGASLLVTSDHGNAERMLSEDGTPFTAHTTGPVRCYLDAPASAQRDCGSPRSLRSGALGDIAPTILELMGLDAPPEMTGRSLLVRRASA